MIGALFSHHLKGFLLQQTEKIQKPTSRHYTNKDMLEHTAPNKINPLPWESGNPVVEETEEVRQTGRDKRHQENKAL